MTLINTENFSITFQTIKKYFKRTHAADDIFKYYFYTIGISHLELVNRNTQRDFLFLL